MDKTLKGQYWEIIIVIIYPIICYIILKFRKCKQFGWYALWKYLIFDTACGKLPMTTTN